MERESNNDSGAELLLPRISGCSTNSSNSNSSTDAALPPQRMSEVDRRSFLRAYSRKSLESNPEDEEFVVGDDGLINVVAVDDRARIGRLRQLLDKKERETRQAAEYGLSLLESNEELHLEIESLKIQQEAETAEIHAERDLYRRRHELAMQEVESWKSECKRLDEIKYQLAAELEKLASPEDGSSNNSHHHRPMSLHRQQQRIDELEGALAELQASEDANAAVIQSLKKWKATFKSQQKQQAGVEEQETSSDKLYTEKLERDCVKLQQQVGELRMQKDQLTVLVDELQGSNKTLKTQMNEIHEKLAAKRHEFHLQSDKLITIESKCGRLERERMIMEQVANLPVAVFDRDDDDDDDDDEDDNEEYDEEDDAGGGAGRDEAMIKSPGRQTEAAPAKRTRALDGGDPTNNGDGSDDEQWFTTAPTTTTVSRSRSSTSWRRGSTMAPFQLPGDGDHAQRVPATPSSLATHQKLHHYFHLTALSIIHENDLHERCFDSSSRATIDTWYREVVEDGIQFLAWHAWLINRIGSVAAAIDMEQKTDSSSTNPATGGLKPTTSSTSPFKKFMQNQAKDFIFPPSPPRTPSSSFSAASSSVRLPPQTPRVSSSVAWTFFSRLVGRRDNQQGATNTA